MKYQLDIEINKPREQVVELFGNPENLAFWQPGFVSIEHVSGEAGKAGSVSRLTYMHGKANKIMVMEEVVNVSNLPDEYSGTYRANMMNMTVGYRFEEISPDKTRLITDNEAEVKGIVMKLMTKLMPGCFKKQSFLYMANFKAFAETGADCRKSA